MEQLVTSNFKLGIIAGGQLGKMLVLAASNWDVKTYVLDIDENCAAATNCTHLSIGDPLKYDDVYNFGKSVDMITYEVENINIEALKQLKKEGKRISPDPEILEIIQDKGTQKEFYKHHNIPSAAFKILSSKSLIKDKINSNEINFPFVQKLRKGGYDGKGVSVIKSITDLEKLLEGPCVIEECVQIKKEIGVIVARNKNGDIKCFPAVEMEFNEHANLVEKLICPTSLLSELNSQAEEIAKKIITELNMCGILAVEFFIDKNNSIYVNEIAPRPHNSGHHTIESVITSQYEQMLRAIFNFPLGSTDLKMPAVMINLLGEAGHDGDVLYEGLTDCMAIDGVKIHLYGKKKTKPFRKMGHVTILDRSIESAKQKADIVKQKLKVKAWKNQS